MRPAVPSLLLLLLFAGANAWSAKESTIRVEAMVGEAVVVFEDIDCPDDMVQVATGEVVETIDNASVGASHGAGTAAANTMRSEGVEAVISGRFGPKAFDALRALGIETWVAPAGITAGEAFRMLDDAGLERMQS